jgi:branched-chain amino acid transport system permease protein
MQLLFRHIGTWLRRARGAEWASLGRRIGPWFVGGAVVGYVVWPMRVDAYSSLWMPLVGGLLALVVRTIVMQIAHAIRSRGGGSTSSDTSARQQPVALDIDALPMAETV